MLCAVTASSPDNVRAGPMHRPSDYPTRPIRVIVAVGPGGVGDLFMRALGEKLSDSLKQPIRHRE